MGSPVLAPSALHWPFVLFSRCRGTTCPSTFRAAGNSQPHAHALPSTAASLCQSVRLCLFCFYDLSQALCQHFTCIGSRDPHHNPMRQKL